MTFDTYTVDVTKRCQGGSFVGVTEENVKDTSFDKKAQDPFFITVY